jgi:hypothetical protein
MDDEHLQLRMPIEHTGGNHPRDVTGRVGRSANRLVEAVLHEYLVSDRLHRWVNMHHEVIRFRKLPQPIYVMDFRGGPTLRRTTGKYARL